MKLSRRGWAAVVLAVGSALLAVVLSQPILLSATVLIGGWLVGRVFSSVIAMRRTIRDLDIEEAIDRQTVDTATATAYTLDVELRTASPLRVVVSPAIPSAGTVSAVPMVTLEPDENSASASTSIEWPIAGRHRFGPVSVTIGDRYVTERIPLDRGPTVLVEPPRPTDVHVGRAGEPFAVTYGQHEGGRFGTGLEPAELRQYDPGDPAKHIDWNATARLRTPHVRKYDAETDRHVVLVIDRRATMGTGVAGRRKLDYCREVALAIAEAAITAGDPLGVVVVDDEAIETWGTQATTGATTATLRSALYELDLTDERRDDRQRAATRSVSPDRPDGSLPPGWWTDQNGSSAFVRTLRSFVVERHRLPVAPEDAPLTYAVRSHREKSRRREVYLFTDDTDRAGSRRAITTARALGDAVTAVLAPSVLYDHQRIGAQTGQRSTDRGSHSELDDRMRGDIAETYARYVSFEEFRRELDALDRVRALEVGPADRTASILAAGTRSSTEGKTNRDDTGDSEDRSQRSQEYTYDDTHTKP